MAQDLTHPKALQAWFDVQSATLRRVHASWFQGVHAELIKPARSRALGRRWLAKHLASSHPLLFELPSDLSASAMELVRYAAWLIPVLEDIEAIALDLGSLALAPTLRTVVTRSAVMKLRQFLGPERYEKMLAAAAVASGSKTEAVLTEADDDIIESVTRCGAWELEGFAERLHPLWGESVRLSFQREWWQADRARSLRDDAVEGTLRLKQQALLAPPVNDAAAGEAA